MTAADPASRVRSPLVLARAAALLTVAACVSAARGWPLPSRTASGWHVAHVAHSLLALVTGAALVCLGAATGLVRPDRLGSRTAAGVWVVLTAVAAVLLGWHDLLVGALGDTGATGVPDVDGLLTFAAALGAGLATRRLGWPAQLSAVLGTAVVTLPLIGLGWSLSDGTTGVLTALSGGLYAVTVFGVLPVMVAVALSRAAVPRSAPPPRS
ncbi:hypothetical protein [Geodermatophilus sp. CPCC 205506]|uniref:hypothetical protein n=1 Tax=Geodermatophilus sp. CPCC 205506 TaxID=2936596 RepID=UPI003EEB891B